MLNNPAATLQEQGDHEGALRLYRQALQLDPDYDLARLNYGEALLAIGDRERARTELTRASASSEQTIREQALASLARLDTSSPGEDR